MIVLLFIIFQSFIESARSVETIIDLNDILRPDLMPTSLMLIEGSGENQRWSNSTTGIMNHIMETNGSWHEAFATMGFHRKMLNEYLCRNFVANSIISQIQKPFISKRIGKPSDQQSTPKRKSRADFTDVKENLLADPGSSNYKDWLSKTTLLEDIYRHYNKDDAVSRTASDSEELEYEGGEITGYAMPDIKDYPHMYPNPPDEMPQDSEKHGGGGYDYTPHHIHFHNQGSNNDEKEYYGLALPDVFDVSLTALAFLSFGIFILQVIMCISMNKTTPMMQMVDNGDTEPVDQIRFRRDASNQRNSINELTRRVLRSIEAGLAANKDDGNCLRRVLCENNKYSRDLEYSKKILVPVWGLGMSWLSGRIYREEPSMTTILESLRACALGLANKDCISLYKNCDIEKLLK